MGKILTIELGATTECVVSPLHDRGYCFYDSFSMDRPEGLCKTPCAIRIQMDDLLSVAQNRDIRVVCRDNRLSTILPTQNGFDQRAYHERIVEMILWLIEDDYPILMAEDDG